MYKDLDFHKDFFSNFLCYLLFLNSWENTLRDYNRDVREIISYHFLKIPLYFFSNFVNPLKISKFIQIPPYYIAYNCPRWAELDLKTPRHIYICYSLSFSQLCLNPSDASLLKGNQSSSYLNIMNYNLSNLQAAWNHRLSYVQVMLWG